MKEKQVFNNAKWIILCKIAQSVLQLIIGMISARYLGPSNYGLINYAASILAFVTPLMKLGFDATLVYELIEVPEKEGEIMGTSLLLNICSSAVCILGVSLFASIANFGQIETIVVCALYSLSLFFTAIEMVQYWFQYKLLSKYSSIIMLVAYVFVSLYKIFLLVTQKNVYWFALSHSVEFGIVGILLLVFYRKKEGSRLKFSLHTAKKMFSRSKHYIFASLMVVVIHNTDHIMLTIMSGRAENGYYSAAITTACVAQFVFTAIIDSFRPMILSSKKENSLDYEKSISRLYGIIIYLSLAQSIIFTTFATFIIKLLYGADYVAAVPILQVLVWYTTFSFMGTVRNIWMLAEDKQKYLPIVNMTGAAINVVLNLFMIPLWSAFGAATASLITQFLMNFILGFIIKPLRKNNELLVKSLNPIFLFSEIKQMAKMIFGKD